jgi:HPt (histidine-containing phosphotransfer) domain-containing protein
VLRDWLPPEKVLDASKNKKQISSKPESADSIISELNKIDEINVKIGLERVSGVEEMYKDSVKFFSNKILSECLKMSDALREKDVHSFSITVHAMKSALATIGVMKLSEIAAGLEAAAKNKETETCLSQYPPLEKELLKLHEKLTVIFPAENTAGRKKTDDRNLLREGVKKAITAADDFDSDEGIEILENIIDFDFGEDVNALLKSALNAFNDFDCSEALNQLNLIKI